MTTRAKLYIGGTIAALIASTLILRWLAKAVVRVEGGAIRTTESERPIDWDWDIYVRVPASMVDYRFHDDQPWYRSAVRLSVPAKVARIERIEAVPMQIRYDDPLGIPHEATVMFDVPKGIANQTKAYLHEGTNWVVLTGPPATAEFAVRTDECSTVRYSVDSADFARLDRTLERGRAEVPLVGTPQFITMRIDFCDGTHSETVREYVRSQAAKYDYVSPEVLAPPSPRERQW